jgi:hypothetical protein
MSWIGLDLLLDSSKGSVLATTTESITRFTNHNPNSTNVFSPPGEDGFDFWYFGEGDGDGDDDDGRSNQLIVGTGDAERSIGGGSLSNNNDDDDDGDDGSMNSNSTYEGTYPSVTTSVAQGANTLVGVVSTESEEITVPSNAVTGTNYLPFSLIPNSIATTLRRRYQPNIVPAELASTPVGVSVTQSTDVNTQPADNNNMGADRNEPDQDQDEEGVTIVSSVRSVDQHMIATDRGRDRNPLGELVMFPTNTSDATIRPFSEFHDIGASLSTGSGSGNETNTDGSGMSSLSLHPSSVESSVVTEWASIHGGESNSFCSNLFSSGGTTAAGGIEIIPAAASDPFFRLDENNSNDIIRTVSDNKVDDKERIAPLSTDSRHEMASKDNDDTLNHVDDNDDSTELESLSSSFIENLNRLRQEARSDIDKGSRGSNESKDSSTFEPWYQGLETDRDWDEFRTILAAVGDELQNDDHNEGYQSRSEGINTTDEKRQEVRLARFLVEQEDILRSITSSNEGPSGTILSSAKEKNKWKLVTDLALLVATAAAASIGYKLLKRR